jgi:hypothetical protein
MALKAQAPNLNAAEIAAIKYYQGDAAYQRQVVLHLGKAPTKADYESGQAKLRAAVTGGQVFGPPKPGSQGFIGKTMLGPVSPDAFAAILKRAQDKGFKPTAAAVEATWSRNMIREQERTKAAVDAVKAEAVRTTAAAQATAFAIRDKEFTAPEVRISNSFRVSASDVISSTNDRGRIVKPSGPRHAVGTGPLR